MKINNFVFLKLPSYPNGFYGPHENDKMDKYHLCVFYHYMSLLLNLVYTYIYIYLL